MIGAKLFQALPNDREETFTVVHANYRPAFHGIPAHSSLKLSEDAIRTASRVTSQTININNSSGFQVGDHNVQHIADSLIGLVESIDAATAPADEEKAAGGTVRELVSNPVVAAVLGGAAKRLMELLGHYRS